MVEVKGKMSYDATIPSLDLTKDTLRVLGNIIEERGLDKSEYNSKKKHLEDEVFTHLTTKHLREVNLEIYSPDGRKTEEYGIKVDYQSASPSSNLDPKKELKEFVKKAEDTTSRLNAPPEGTRYKIKVETDEGAVKVE